MRMDAKILKAHAAMLGANVMWGLASPVGKFVLQSGEVGSLALATFRMLGAALVFWVVSFFTKSEHVSHKDLLMLFFASLLGIVLNQGSFTVGLGMTSPVNASIITTTTPIITMIIAALYLREPVTGKKVLGIFLGASGAMLLILSSRHIGNRTSDIRGDLLCLFAQFSFSCYFVFFKGLIGRYSPVTLMKWMFTYASICCIPFTYGQITAIDFQALPAERYAGILYMILGGTFLSYLLVPVGQRTLRPTVACMYNYVQPIVASVVAVIWGMDTFGWTKVAAVVLVFTGVYVVTRSRSREQLEAYRRLQAGAAESPATKKGPQPDDR